MKRMLILLMAFFTLNAFPLEPILSCSIQGKYGNVNISFTDHGRSNLTWTHANGTYQCPLKLIRIENKPRAVVPLLNFKWTKGNCGGLPEKKNAKTILEVITLTIREPFGGRPSPQFQWSGHQQPEICTLEVFNRERLIEKAEKFSTH